MRQHFTSILTAAAVSTTLFAAISAQAATRFDGQWSVEIITEKGDCDTYRYPVAIEDGRVRYAGREGFDVSGSVTQGGAVSGSISRGADGARVRGKLDARWGSGSWTASGSKSCSGRWTGEKRG